MVSLASASRAGAPSARRRRERERRCVMARPRAADRRHPIGNAQAGHPELTTSSDNASTFAFHSSSIPRSSGSRSTPSPSVPPRVDAEGEQDGGDDDRALGEHAKPGDAQRGAQRLGAAATTLSMSAENSVLYR